MVIYLNPTDKSWLIVLLIGFIFHLEFEFLVYFCRNNYKQH
ncbi:hypothetical protein SAMN05444143_107136 [Flavobacterium succinicans]|jgi:hypothetical protein|uniref:Uncharacterized protein n=1 Tax=Flavobacterium succinicans TaxID=29536 RepID=A0A1I4WWK7_9FLAO|nr:hypothetical protein SAMN05444143_107136 [Flavobacterium succinicans]